MNVSDTHFLTLDNNAYGFTPCGDFVTIMKIEHHAVTHRTTRTPELARAIWFSLQSKYGYRHLVTPTPEPSSSQPKDLVLYS